MSIGITKHFTLTLYSITLSDTLLWWKASVNECDNRSRCTNCISKNSGQWQISLNNFMSKFVSFSQDQPAQYRSECSTVCKRTVASWNLLLRIREKCVRQNQTEVKIQQDLNLNLIGMTLCDISFLKLVMNPVFVALTHVCVCVCHCQTLQIVKISPEVRNILKTATFFCVVQITIVDTVYENWKLPILQIYLGFDSVLSCISYTVA